MKRCPQCLFLYPDSDEKCDFDQTPLESIDDSTVEAATRQKKRSTLPLAAVVALVVGAVLFAIFYTATHRTKKVSPEFDFTNVVSMPSPTAPVSSPTSTPEPSPSPSPSPSPKASPSRIATAHTSATSDPVSTSGPGIGTRIGGKPVIMLTSGGKIDADEVWRTKDGVWYRRNGMVTLLKRGQVKSIVTR
jgi:hypothetical protein